MKTVSRAARRYAHALYLAAQDGNQAALIATELESIRDIASRCPDLQAFLRHPALTVQQHVDGLAALFDGRVGELTMRFLRLLAEKRRLAVLEAICQAFDELHLEANNIVRARVTSALPMSESQLETLREKLRARYERHISVVPDSDRALKGGFVVQVGDTVHDASIRGRLERLRLQLCRP